MTNSSAHSVKRGVEERQAAYSKSLFGSLALATLLLVGGFVYPILKEALTDNPEEEQLKVQTKKVINYSQLSAPPPIDLNRPEPPKITAPPKAKQVKFIQPVAKKDEEVEEEEYIPTMDEMDQVQVGATEVEGADSIDLGGLFEVEEVTQEPAEIFTVAEVMPSYPGGDQALIGYLSANLRYPQIAKEVGIQGVVYVQFVVETDGSIAEINVIRSVHPAVDAEAVRVISNMPDWNPGYQNDRPARVYYTIPLRFVLK